MRRESVLFLAIVCSACFLLALSGCKEGDDNGGGGAQQDANSAFNGTFSGNFTSRQGGQDFVDTITMTLAVGSPLSGTFRTGAGATGTISGDADGNTATFSATIEGPCSGSLSGSMTLTNDNTLSFDAAGSDCEGAFTSSGTLNRSEPPNIRGTYVGSATATNTNCIDSDINRSFEVSVVVEILSQEGMTFQGTTMTELAFEGETFAGVDDLDGSITVDGQISGTLDGTFEETRHTGTFTGQVSGNTLTYDFVSQDTVGETCMTTGSITATR